MLFTVSLVVNNRVIVHPELVARSAPDVFIATGTAVYDIQLPGSYRKGITMIKKRNNSVVFI